MQMRNQLLSGLKGQKMENRLAILFLLILGCASLIIQLRAIRMREMIEGTTYKRFRILSISFAIILWAITAYVLS